MTPTFGTHSSVESTIELLAAELPRLEEQQHTLEKDLAAVTQRLESVRGALRSLQALSPAPLLHEVTAEAVLDTGADTTATREEGTKRRTAKTTPRPAARTAAEPASEQTRTASVATARKTAVGRKRAAASARPQPSASAAKARKTATVSQPAPSTTPKKRTSGLTDDILAHLSAAKAPVRAREVNQALGREDTPGSINAVRTSLERLAKASRVQRPSRGHYQTLPR